MIDRYSRPKMKRLWTEEAKYESWARIEKAHLQTLVSLSLAPPSVVSSFDKSISTKTEKDFLEREKETAHDVIAFISEIGDGMKEHSSFLHQGLTSSDVLDTSLALRLRESLEIIVEELSEVRLALAEQSFTHTSTIMMGRSHGIHAEPLSFGQVLAGHFSEFQRAHLECLQAIKDISYGKLSGAVGQYSQLNPKFESLVLNSLNLKSEPVATQVIPRDRHLRAARALESVANAVERFAVNFRHWARTELGEVLEPFSSKQKGSSAMPHKKNPVLAENLTGLARTIRGYTQMLTQNTALWHERDISHSSAERIAFPDLFVTTDFMLGRLSSLVKNMQVNKEAMKTKLDLTGGLWASGSVLTHLVEKGMDRTKAYELVQAVALPISAKVSTGEVKPGAFKEALLSEKSIATAIKKEDFETIFEPKRFLTHVDTIYKNVFGTTKKEFDHHPSDSVQKRVPSLHHIYKVTVELLPDVLDVEAKAIAADMLKSNIPLLSVRQSKTFQVRLESHNESVDDYAREVLHNSVMEQYEVEVIQ